MKDEILQTEEEIQLWTDAAATALGRVIGQNFTEISQSDAAARAAAYADALVAEYRKRT